MRVIQHVAYTWLLAHAIHPIVWMIAIWFKAPSPDLSAFQDILGLCVFALLISTPAVLVYYLVNKWVIRSEFSPQQKFVIWLIGASLVTACTALMLMMFLTDFEFVLAYIDELALYIAPSVIATILSVCARYDYFIEHNTKYHSVENKS
jgi:hypothetical protein